LLHSPDVLFLDEPTIGLDVVAQHNIQQFLKRYQQERKITILLTSHYMKDVAALCHRAVIISQGQIQYDGSLSGIIDTFSGHKIVTLQFGDNQPLDNLSQYGEVVSVQPRRAKLRIDRGQVTKSLAAILSRYSVDDVAVEDPPLEEVIAAAFRRADKAAADAATEVDSKEQVGTS
jgi:ABC-2 type transport system ATP-binding protein